MSENRSVRPKAARRSVEAADDVGTRRRMMSAFCRIPSSHGLRWLRRVPFETTLTVVATP